MRKLTDEVVEEMSQTEPSQQTGEYGERLHIPAEIFIDILTKDKFNFNIWNEKGNILCPKKRGKNGKRRCSSREITYI